MNADTFDCKNSRVLIIGPLNLQNEFLAYVLNRELGTRCILVDREQDSIWSGQHVECSDRTHGQLILVDTEDQSFGEILQNIAANVYLSECYISLFNLSVDAGIEKKALSKNIRGFFYKEDRFEIFLKGIRTILSGEVWISRAVLLKCVFDGFREKQVLLEEKTALTARELEILSLVSMGSTNEEIANKVFISTNTVKTHLYNIFKKINVENRLQAALWAAANL